MFLRVGDSRFHIRHSLLLWPIQLLLRVIIQLIAFIVNILKEKIEIHFMSPRVLSNKWALQQAKFNTEKYYSVVGILEKLDDTLRVLENYIPRFFSGASNYGKQLTPSRHTYFHNAIPIVIYHSAGDKDLVEYNTSPILFEDEMKYLHDNNFQVLTMRDLAFDRKTNDLFIK